MSTELNGLLSSMSEEDVKVINGIKKSIITAVNLNHELGFLALALATDELKEFALQTTSTQ